MANRNATPLILAILLMGLYVFYYSIGLRIKISGLNSLLIATLFLLPFIWPGY
jgi:hypothetical protein